CRTADDIRIADCTVAAGGDGCQPWRILQVKEADEQVKVKREAGAIANGRARHTQASASANSAATTNQQRTQQTSTAAGSFPHSNSLAAAAAAARFLVACMHNCIEYAAAAAE
uniref:Uncharacterized protein n=1 Tax=Oryza glaberrima TaxID=4538 RepID=I1QXU5_ORYGL